MATSGTSAMNTSLAQRLKGLSPKELKSVASTINKVSVAGMKIDDVFPIGIIINDPDGIEVRGHLDPSKIADLSRLLPGIDIKEIRLFPRGIVAPDVYRVHMALRR